MWFPPSKAQYWQNDKLDEEEHTPVVQLSEEEIRKLRIDAGLCPECGKKGEWISLAMVCQEHGIFL